MAYTPGRVGALRSGYYADPASPIASTPQRGKAPTVSTRAVPATPSLATLSPMHAPAERPLQRASGEDEKAGMFAPTFKFDDDKGAAGGASGGAGVGTAVARGGAAAMPASTVALSAAPAARRAGAVAAPAPAPVAAGGYVYSATTVAASRTTAASGATTSTAALAHRTAVALSLHSDDGSAAGGAGGYAPAPAVAATAAASGAGAVAVRPVAAAVPVTAAPTVPAIAPAPADEEEEEGQYEYEYEEFNPYLFIKLLPEYRTVAPRVPRIVLPKKSARAPLVTLVLDLDETLVHCSVDPIADADVSFPVTFNGCNYQVYVRKRPHLDKFLAWITGKFEVVIFTASQQVYAEKLLDLLDPSHKHIDHRLYRDSCLNVDGNYLKDLNVLGRDLTKAVLVDNSPHAFGYQLDNGVPIESWFDDRADTELLKLMKFLETIQAATDVRPFVRDKFRVHKLVADAR